MKIKAFFAALLFSLTAFAGNTITKVERVTDGVTLTEDVDYIITDATTPFSESGSVDIVNTAHAVLIFQGIKPSVVISKYLSHVYVNGEPAKNDVNCQVRMFAHGAIVFPYDNSLNPLTCYTKPNFEGDSYSDYSLGHSGGYMNTMNDRLLNNNVRSFKLKRGYMVTFAVGTGGWGYSRCFIADLEDLEVATLPNVLNGKISSYRIFKWFNAQKKGLASDTRAEANDALNTSWCYDWGQGNGGRLPDQEWVPNHIYEDWPSSATCGSVTQSCHMKTNNEPGNSADDHPQDVATVLGNWQNLMRTGMRLCSESSHDGSMNHLKAFIDSIDARGWRCDILDLHGYWPSGTFNNLNWYSDYYGNGRPIWISEWIWGASWNRNGAFADGVTDAQILNETKNILNVLNNNPRVERYAYWNSESKAKIYNNGLTELGKYYASMESGLAYNKTYEYIPKVVYKAPSAIKGTFNKTKKTFAIEWTDPNGDMLDSIVVEVKVPGSSKWTKDGNVMPKDKTSNSDLSYTYTATLVSSTPGVYAYRVVEYYDGGKKFTSAESSFSLAAANAVGALQYGEMKIANTESVTTDIEAQEKAPYVVVGMISNKNAGNGITNQVQTLAKSSFKFRFFPWTLASPVNFSSVETASYIVLPPDTVWTLDDDKILISQKIGNVKGDEVEVVFPQAFPTGVVPVVLAQQNTTVGSYAPVTVKVYDVTNIGFKVKLVRQEGVTAAFNAQNVNYFAASPGQYAIGTGKLLTVGRDSETPVGGTARQTVYFKNAEGETLHLLNPYIVAASQTDNYEVASVFRMHSTTDDEDGVYCASIRRQTDGTTTNTTANNAKNNGDYIGWFIISDDPNGTGDEEPLITIAGTETGIEDFRQGGFSVSTADGIIYAEGDGLRAYSPNGAQVVLGHRLAPGIYIVTNGKQSVKVVVK